VIRRRILSSRWLAALLVTLFTVGGAAGGYAVEHAKGPQFQASTQVLVRFWAVESFLLSGQSNQVTSTDVADAATLASSADVLGRAATALHDGRTANDLAATVVVTPSSTSNAVTIAATATTPVSAKTTSEAVATAMIAALRDRITASSQGLDGVASSDYQAQLQQRADVLNLSVHPLVALATGNAVQTAPTSKSLIAFAIVGLAAGTLLVVGLRFARPTIEEARVAQRLTSRPGVAFDRGDGGPEAARLLRRLLDERPKGSVMVMPVDAEAEKSARALADWARSRSTDALEAVRIVSVPEPAGAVLAPRPTAGEVAAVLLVVPRGTARRTLADAMTLLSAWRSADAVVVTT
jgi:capsular polysaccharide biosynthesis protein